MHTCRNSAYYYNNKKIRAQLFREDGSELHKDLALITFTVYVFIQ
jgi:hypothetical protein